MENEVSRVLRPRSEARASYDRLSRWYDWVSAPFERKSREHGLAMLDARPGECVLEVGFGTGWALLSLADSVGPSGLVIGIDPSSGMLKKAGGRAQRHEFSRVMKLLRGDAVVLPLQAQVFDAVFLSFVLELFDTPDIPRVLRECWRVLHPAGRICVVSLSKTRDPGALERMYEGLHAAFPITFDCRPIHVSASVTDVGFTMTSERAGNLWGLPVSIVLATKPDSR